MFPVKFLPIFWEQIEQQCPFYINKAKPEEELDRKDR